MWEHDTLPVRITALVAPGAITLLVALVETTVLIGGIGVLWLLAALLPPAGSAGAHEEPDRTPRIAQFADGLREARRHPWFVAGLGALTTVIFAGYSVTSVVLPVVSRDRYDSEGVLAAAVSAYTAGALLGAVLIARWRPRNQGVGGPGRAGLLRVLATEPDLLGGRHRGRRHLRDRGLGIELFNVPWFRRPSATSSPACWPGSHRSTHRLPVQLRAAPSLQTPLARDRRRPVPQDPFGTILDEGALYATPLGAGGLAAWPPCRSPARSGRSPSGGALAAPPLLRHRSARTGDCEGSIAPRTSSQEQVGRDTAPFGH